MKKSQQEAVLMESHMRTADRLGAEFTNLGWYSSDDRIESKTTKGILVTVVDGTGRTASKIHRY